MQPEIILSRALDAWDTPAFSQVLKAEIEDLDAALLPLQQGLAQGSQVSARGFTVLVLGARAEPGTIYVTTGIQFTGILAGCACADDPTPDGEYAEYCEVRLEIDRRTARTAVSLLAD